MPYWILDKTTDTPAIRGSIKKVSQLTGISENVLYYCFSKNKKKEYIDDKYRIHKIKQK